MDQQLDRRGQRVSPSGTCPIDETVPRGNPWRLVAISSFLTLSAVVLAAVYFLLPGRSVDSASGISVLRTEDFHALAFSPDDPNVVFFGHHNGVMRSDDGGRNWWQLIQKRDFDAMGLATNPANPSQLYLAGHLIFQVSNDGGSSWQPVAHDLPHDDIHGFALSPDDPSRLYAFVYGYGLFTSSDGGRRWTRLSGQLPDDVMALAAAGGNPETLYAGSMGSGLLRSGDGGRTWTPSGDGLGAQGVMALAVDPVARQTVYAGGGLGLFKSTNGARSWSKLPFPGSNGAALAVSRVRPNVVLAITVKDGQGIVLRSEDGGLSWGARR